jgi:hypothetical protein
VALCVPRNSARTLKAISGQADMPAMKRPQATEDRRRSSRDRRRLKRYVQPLEAHFQSGRLRGLGYVRNLSKEGMFISSDQLPQPGAPIALTIETPGGNKIDLNGTVRWTTAQLPNASGAPAGFGVRFEHSPAYRQLYEALLLR